MSAAEWVLKILPPVMNESGRSFSVNKESIIRFGLAGVRNVGENAINSILGARKDGPFTSLLDSVNVWTTGPLINGCWKI